VGSLSKRVQLIRARFALQLRRPARVRRFGFAMPNVSAMYLLSFPETKASSTPRISSRKPFKMRAPSTVALVADPDFSGHLLTVSTDIRTELISPTNQITHQPSRPTQKNSGRVTRSHRYRGNCFASLLNLAGHSLDVTAGSPMSSDPTVSRTSLPAATSSSGNGANYSNVRPH